MKISILKKKNKNNRTSLYLVYYNGYTKDKAGGLKLNRKYEKLDVWINTEPKNTEQRKENKEKLQLVDSIISKKEVEALSGKFEFSSLIEKRVTLFDFLNQELNNLSVADNTNKNYQSLFTHLFEYCNPDSTMLSSIDEDFIRGFKEYLDNISNKKDKPLRNNSKIIYLSKFKGLMTKAYKRGLISKNPFNMIKNYKKEHTNVIYLTADEIGKLDKSKCKSELIKNAFLFSCFTGLRVSDLKNLKWSQVVRESKTLKIIINQQKTDEPLYLPIQEQAVKYLGKRGKPDENIFKGLMNNTYANQILMSWVYEAGIKKKVTFHKARHSNATLLLNSGSDLYTVSKILGHKRMESTQIYAKVVDKSIQEAFNKFPKIS